MWHVGILYRMCDLLELIREKPLASPQLLGDFPYYHDVETRRLLDMANTGNWIRSDNSGTLIITSAGESLLQISSPAHRLRLQLETLMNVLGPPWAATMAQGRRAFVQYAPPEVVQCFHEAGILDCLESEVIVWWDRFARRYRQEKEAERVETGRKGERLSFEYERNRTGMEPYWMALEYDGAGYDLISRISSENHNKLLVEVKTSRYLWENAKFFLSRNEWDVLSAEQNAVLHLWSLTRTPYTPAVVPIVDIGEHIPAEKGSGHWQMIECPFAQFENYLIN